MGFCDFKIVIFTPNFLAQQFMCVVNFVREWSIVVSCAIVFDSFKIIQ